MRTEKNSSDPDRYHVKHENGDRHALKYDHEVVDAGRDPWKIFRRESGDGMEYGGLVDSFTSFKDAADRFEEICGERPPKPMWLN